MRGPEGHVPMETRRALPPPPSSGRRSTGTHEDGQGVAKEGMRPLRE
ncbi:hypothetical protein D187_002010 [Cystobacter fuscus DSM 2262]|uniref:Uncharacterized protein n=1 Tax=Cystobacter fuscus (strain ATCC 25194 / DSM 2262 / NBRC 100088 / M29) TaxID=1242864 RepID=S9QV38_CYSF2|nr:hypothetical protein D187_002010 [Cystobacter fuscus DSM 2262]